jgi:putative lipoic acid-binding regulatory protein
MQADRGIGKGEGIMFTGVKVFSATKAKEREELGEHVTRWIREHKDAQVVDKIVTQSSDREFHCLTITIFYQMQQ